MSAVATTDAAPLTEAAPIHLVDDSHRRIQQMHDAEQMRWMVWFGTPMLVVALFVGITFATDEAWWLGLGILTLIADILVLVWLAMSSDTNGLIDDGLASPSH